MSLSLRTVLPNVSPAVSLSSLPICSSLFCPRPATLWQRWWSRNEGIWLRARWYCSVDCFQDGLFRHLEAAGFHHQRTPAQPNRIPLGLLLLSQGDISRTQLRQALALQQTTRGGKLGEWLVKMGAVSEQQVTAALAVQQRCPVFASCEAHALPERLNWPEALTVSYGAVPVFHNPSEATLYVGFLFQVNHAFLYAVEQILHCRTLPCIVPLATYRERLEWNGFETPGETIEILQRQDGREVTETVGSYAQQIRAEHCSVSSCEDRLWVRLESARRSHVDFLFRLSTAAG